MIVNSSRHVLTTFRPASFFKFFLFFFFFVTVYTETIVYRMEDLPSHSQLEFQKQKKKHGHPSGLLWNRHLFIEKKNPGSDLYILMLPLIFPKFSRLNSFQLCMMLHHDATGILIFLKKKKKEQEKENERSTSSAARFAFQHWPTI